MPCRSSPPAAAGKAQQLLDEHADRPGGRKLILVTAHRRENFGAPLENICRALRRLAGAYPDRLQIVYPVHLNPNVQEPVQRPAERARTNITLLPPLDYLPLVT